MADASSNVLGARARATAGKRADHKSGRGARRAARESVSEDAVPYLLRQVAERLSRSLSESLKPFQHPANVYRVLIALERRGAVPIGELAEETLIDASTLSRAVDRMEEQGLVKHGPGGTDGRTVMVDITEPGRQLFHEILPVASAQYEWSIRSIPAKNLAVLQATLKQMLANLKVSPFK